MLDAQGNVYNCMVDLFWFFKFETKQPLEPDEFVRFWTSLTNEQKDYYRTTPLS